MSDDRKKIAILLIRAANRDIRIHERAVEKKRRERDDGIRALAELGLSAREIGETVGLSHVTVLKAIRKEAR